MFRFFFYKCFQESTSATAGCLGQPSPLQSFLLSNISSSQLTGVLLLLLLALSLACNISDASLFILILIAHSLKLGAGIC